MRTSSDGIALIKAFEGCLKPAGNGMFMPYVCPAGVLTICYGHTNHHEPKFNKEDRWSTTACEDALRADLQIFEKRVERLAPEVKKQHQFDALVSWAYNTGGPDSSSVWKAARAGNEPETRLRLSRWNKGGGQVLNGLVRRREAEADLFEGKIDEALRTAGAVRPTPQDPSARTDRSKPTPSSTDIAKRTKGEAATTAAGGAAAGGGTVDKGSSWVTQAAIVLGVALALVGLVLLARKIKAVRVDWA